VQFEDPIRVIHLPRRVKLSDIFFAGQITGSLHLLFERSEPWVAWIIRRYGVEHGSGIFPFSSSH
jgi:hypothetical protein